MTTRARLDGLGRMRDLAESAVKPEAAKGVRPSFTTEELFGPQTEIDIAHQGLVYRLRITRQGKLVLNK